MDKAEEIFTAVNELDPYKGFDRSRPADVKGLVEDMQQLNKLVGNVKVKQRKAAQEKLDSQLEDKKKQTIVEMKKQHANELADSKNAYEESAKEQIFDPLFSDKGFDVLMRVNGSKGIKKGVDRNRISPVVKEWAAETKQPISDGEKRSLSTRLNEIMKAEETNSEKSRTRSKLAIYDDLPEPLRLKLQTNAAVRDKFKGTLIKFYQNEAQNKGLEGNLADFYSSMLGGSSLSKDEIKKYLKSGENLSEKAAFDKAMANLVAVTYDSTIATATDTATATATAESALKALQAKCDQNEKIKKIQEILTRGKVDNINEAVMLREHLVSQYAKRYSLPKKHKHTAMPNRLKGMEAAKYDPAVLKGIQITDENLPQVGPLLIKALEDDKANLIHRKHRDYWVSQIQHAAVTSDKEEHFFKADLEKLGYDATDIHDLAENIDAINYDYSLDVLEKLKEFEDAMKYRGSTNDTRTRFTNRSSTDEEIKTKYNKIQRDVASVRASIIDKLKNGTGLSLIKPALEKAIKDCKGGIRRGIQRTSREDIIDTLKDHINPPSNPATP